MKQTLIAIVGAAAGGALGLFLVPQIMNLGLYPAVWPGGFLALGACLGKLPNRWMAIIFGVAALTLGIYSEWKAFPFLADDSFGYFVRHIYEVMPIHLILICLGGAIGFWAPFQRAGSTSLRGTKAKPKSGNDLSEV